MTTSYAHDWAHTCNGGGIAGALSRWALLEPQLASLPLDAIMRRAQGSPGGGDPGQADLVLGALLRLAPTDPLARRTALQAILPRLIRAARTLSRRPGSPCPAEVTSDLVALTWEELGRCAGRWPGHLAARLVTDVTRRHSRSLHHQVYEHPVAEVTLSARSGGGHAEEDALAGIEVTTLLRNAIKRGVLQPLAARTLYDVAFGGLTDAQIAGAWGATPGSVKKARQRALAALRTHGPALGLKAG